MIPTDMSFLEYLDDNGNMKDDAPDDIKELYEQWKRRQEEWKKQRSKEMKELND